MRARQVALCGIFAAAVLAIGPAGAQRPVVTFQAPVDRVREAKELIRQGLGPDDSVEVSERATVYRPHLAINDVRKGAPEPAPDEVRFLVAYLQANLDGDPLRMLAFWAPDERATYQKDMRNPAKVQAIRDFYGRFPGLAIAAIVEQAETTTVYVARGLLLQGIHLRRVPERFFLTAKPDNDLSLAVIEAALLYGSNDSLP
jgi:hypothetical protein